MEAISRSAQSDLLGWHRVGALSFREADADQWKRFQGLPNLIYSDGIEWGLYRSGKQTRFCRLSDSPLLLGVRAVTSDDLHQVTALITDFLNWKPIPPTTAKQ